MQKIIFDCDPGHDDALAIILVAKHVDIIGVTTVGGNQTIEKVTENALKVLEVLQMSHIPVYPGSEAPWIQKLETAPQYHGESGLDGPVLPKPIKKPQKTKAAQFYIDAVNDNKEISVVATGPLTNIATALQLEPSISQKIKDITIMGGSASFGNWTPAAEFNIYVDPEAAYKVFNSGIPIRMCGLNLTRQAFFTRKDLAILQEIDNRVAVFCYDLLDYFLESTMKSSNMTGGNLHDVCAAAWVVDETLVKSMDMHVQIELNGKYTRGMTICDHRHLRGTHPEKDLDHDSILVRRGDAPNCSVGLELDVEGFFSLLYDTIRSY
jgi:purine nucleosidase